MLFAQSPPSGPLDVLAYQVQLEPFFRENYIEGNVSIQFKTSPQASEAAFDAGNLIVSKAVGADVISFTQKAGKTIISLRPNETHTYDVQLSYHGNPKRGLVFFSDAPKMYSVYFTQEWMVCNAAPDDRAALQLELIIPKGVISVASGILSDSAEMGDKVRHTWTQSYETPAYTYGFAIGSFNLVKQTYKGIQLKYYAENYIPAEMKQIFGFTGDMMCFFEEKSGLPFPQAVYSQILMGNHYQEMSGFSILKKAYGTYVLKDSTETNLISHELAHQWWGNMITCKSWRHFWLNEGFATFMSAAYNEYRFGAEKYQADIDSYYKVYEAIKSRGGDKPLVFDNWINPSGDDRNLVYFKGAYVLHLLKKMLGEDAFWEGIRHYTQTFYGKSVTTKDFQLAMEESSGMSLEAFFKKWAY